MCELTLFIKWAVDTASICIIGSGVGIGVVFVALINEFKIIIDIIINIYSITNFYIPRLDVSQLALFVSPVRAIYQHLKESRISRDSEIGKDIWFDDVLPNSILDLIPYKMWIDQWGNAALTVETQHNFFTVLIKSWKVVELIARSHENYLFLYATDVKVFGVITALTSGYFLYTVGPAILLGRLAFSSNDLAVSIAQHGRVVETNNQAYGDFCYRIADGITDYLTIPIAKIAYPLFMSTIDPTLVLLGVSSILIVVASYYFIKSFTPVEVEECIKPKISAWVKRGESDTLALLDPKDPSQFILVTNKRKPEIYYSKKEFPTEESIQTPPGNTTLCSIDETPFTLIDDLLGTLYFISVFLVALFLLWKVVLFVKKMK